MPRTEYGQQEAEDGGKQASKQFSAGGKTHYGRRRERKKEGRKEGRRRPKTINEPPQFSLFTTYSIHRSIDEGGGGM